MAIERKEVSVCVCVGRLEAVVQGLGPEGRERCAENDQTAQRATDSALLRGHLLDKRLHCRLLMQLHPEHESSLICVSVFS